MIWLRILLHAIRILDKLLGGLIGSALLAGRTSALLFSGIEKTLTFTVITALLIAGGMLDSLSFVVPIQVVLGAGFAIALGTFFGGWKGCTSF